LHSNAAGSGPRARGDKPREPKSRGPKSTSSRDYLIVVPVRFHRLGSSRVAAESAFCEHLRALRDSLIPTFARLTVASPAMAAADYERDRDHLGVIEENDERIRWVALQPGDAGRFAFWLLHFAGVFKSLWREVRRADLVHAGTSHNVYRPIEFIALLLGLLFRKRTLCVIDIDLREEARMNHRTGRLGRKSLYLCRFVYDPLRSLQLRIAARWCSLLLLKGRRLCRDYGRGRAHVKYILESAFSADQVISPPALADKAEALADPEKPLELVYFGRLAGYKGIDRCIAAVATATELGAAPLRLTIIGAGGELASLQALCVQLGVEHLVEFRPALPYGPRLFERLYPRHLLLAAPLSEDTPRSALDAMACGIPILAFDTEYYSSLAESDAVDLVPWPSAEHMAERIAHLGAKAGSDRQRAQSSGSTSRAGVPSRSP
jgi:glycosyltransferase involved in cell wall biosynthesis